jgi:SPP1 gp7 family putative phage head morphogenesis protein
MNRKAIDPNNPDVSPYLLDLSVWNITLANTLRPTLERMIRQGILDAAADVNVTLSFDALNELVLTELEEYTGFLARSVNEVTQERLRMVLSDGIANGATRYDLVNRVRSILGEGASRYRAEMIARTELTRAHARGRDVQYKQMGAVRKVWYAGIDACPFCRAIDGTVIGIDEKFFGTGEQLIVEHEGRDINLLLDYEDVRHPPLHPHCNCEVKYEFD